MRVLRPDKTAIAGLAATLQHYAEGVAEQAVPVWRMIAAEPEDLKQRANAWQAAVTLGHVEPSQSAIGGGSLPGETRPTYVWSWSSPHAMSAARGLREQPTAVIARVEHERLVLDPRTVLPNEDADVIATLQAVVGVFE